MSIDFTTAAVVLMSLVIQPAFMCLLYHQYASERGLYGVMR